MVDDNINRIESAVGREIARLDAMGVYPSGDRVAAELEDYPGRAVRKVRRHLIDKGLKVSTPNDNPFGSEPIDGADLGTDRDVYAAMAADAVSGSRALGPGKRNHSAVEAAFNVAVYKLVHGHKGIYNHLSYLTGLSPNALKCRVNNVVAAGVPADDGPAKLDDEDARYIERRYGLVHDAATREWVSSAKPARRRHPDRMRFRGKPPPD